MYTNASHADIMYILVPHYSNLLVLFDSSVQSRQVCVVVSSYPLVFVIN